MAQLHLYDITSFSAMTADGFIEHKANMSLRLQPYCMFQIQHYDLINSEDFWNTMTIKKHHHDA